MSFATVLFHVNVVGLINGIILIIIFHVYFQSTEVIGELPNTNLKWLIVVSIGLLSFIGQASLTIGLQIEAAGLLSMMRKAFQLIFAYSWQIALFKVYHMG